MYSLQVSQLEMHMLEILRWKWGGPRDFWLAKAELVGNFIENAGLKALESKHAPIDFSVLQPDFAPREASAGARVLPRDPGIRGGVRTPHLHYAGGFYALNPRQWQEFTGIVMQDVIERVQSAGTVSFEQLLDVGEATARM